MPFELMVGPPASGKTTRLLQRAREAVQAGRRVWWVGLPNQRSYVYRGATEAGGVLGLEFLTMQQVAYRLLADALRLRPLVVGSARLVLVGEALLATERAIPAPGEAQLFAYAIAEAKQFGVGPADMPVQDRATERLRAVFGAYERLKGEHWDYDDFRAESLALARRREGPVEADLILVDGFREVRPIDLSLYRELGNRVEVAMALSEPPPGVSPDVTLDSRQDDAPHRGAKRDDATHEGAKHDGATQDGVTQDCASHVTCYRAKNPVAEARWVLRSLKRDLAAGIDPLDLAVIMPDSRTLAFAALADEYGIPVMDETPRSLADTPAGRRLTDLLALPEAPTAARLLAVAELEPLGRAVLARGLAGSEAVGLLATEVGLEHAWRAWRARLAPDGAQVDMAWVREMVELAVVAEPDPAQAERFREQALRRAKEAARLAAGAHFRAWWTALLQDTDRYEDARGGVALLDAAHASGRRFERAYLMGAVAGAFRPGIGEDWFIPEEARASWEDVFRNPGAKSLPRRFRGASEGFFRELLTRGDDTIVTFPAADRDGPLEPARELVTEPVELPDVPAGSRLELSDDNAYRAPRSAAELHEPSVARLQRYAECGFRTWAEDVVGVSAELAGHGGAAWWRSFRDELLRDASLSRERVEELKRAHPETAAWLSEHAHVLEGLTFDVRLHDRGGNGSDDAPWARLDAARREGATAAIYRFTAPGSAETPAQAEAVLAGEWNEMWAAGRLLQGYGGKIDRVDIHVWPILGSDLNVFEGGVTYPWRRVTRATEGVAAAYDRFVAGDIEPRPGFICRSCLVADVCREGMR